MQLFVELLTKVKKQATRFGGYDWPLPPPFPYIPFKKGEFFVTLLSFFLILLAY